MPRKNRPLTLSEAVVLRKRVWRHNSYFGHCAMMKKQLENIIHAETTTDESRHAAAAMLDAVRYLTATLKIRR